ncbi:signal peptide peptidase SppA [uncultured Pseudoteredinibacter sp.]|uniref:signal peptide peptidase SppA n=1 Tax=uncultured Pseudoteredinibacter sp. TaxID=1641701 RepID=UPI00260BED98|nr:signal peptide peptidase SppA [uncultured Pseudoteredinibacter sp.]
MTETAKRPLILRLLSGIWDAINGLRRIVLNILFFFLLIAFIVALQPKGPKPLTEKTALVIAPSGYLVDQLSAQDPFAQLMGNNSRNETRLRDLQKAIEKAKDDDMINSMVLDLGGMAGGLSKLDELGQSIEDFKSTGKPVYAVGDYYSQSQYYLAAYADEIYLNPMGGVSLMGFASYRNYYKDALDKLAVNVHVFKVGQYKDFLEPYMRNDMSEASKEHNGQWLNQLWAHYTQSVETQRELESGSINALINNMDTRLAEANGDSAALALSAGYVDELLPRHKQLAKLQEKVGKNEDGDGYRGIDSDSYLALELPSFDSKEDKVGLIVASGTILDGEQPEGTIGGDTLAELIRQAKEEKLKALVLRVDSGGGSAFASEIIRQQLLDLQEDIPVIVSMGSVAASGGYWISATSDEIWATPTTITGSIGVFGAFPTLEESLKHLGIHTDGLGTTLLAGSMRVDRTLSPLAERVVQQGVEQVYKQFLDIAAEGRESTPEAINEIAQGRVWSGEQALANGLVDKLGGLNDAIKAAAERAEISDYDVIEIKRKLSPSEQFMQELANNLDAKASVNPWLKPINQKLASWFSPVVGAIDELNSLNDPKGMYARCVACAAP